MKSLVELCRVTCTLPDDWEPMDGPQTGCGEDYWFKHLASGREAYVNDDQGHLTVDCDLARQVS